MPERPALSVLDLVPVRTGLTSSQAVTASLALAGRAVLDHLAAPAEPQAAGLLQGFAQRHRQAASGGLAGIGQAIGYNNESRHQITASHDADRRIAQLMMPTIE